MNNQNNRSNSPSANGPRQQSRSGENNSHSRNRRPQNNTRDNNRDNRGPNRPSGPNDYHRSRGDSNRQQRPIHRNNRTMNSSQILMKYDQLLELHLKDRRKYFEFYNRVDYYQRNKLEKQFFASIEQLRKFEDSLESWQKDYLKRKTEKYRLDLTYSTNHELPPISEKVDEKGNFEDPHFTKSQREAFEYYKNDTEESIGSFDDYLKYKNL